MKLTETFKDMVIRGILDDASLTRDVNDWWTSFTDYKGHVYDVNVYSLEFDDRLTEDEFSVSVYHVDNKTGETDTSESLVNFKIHKSEVIEDYNKTLYQVNFWHTTYGKCQVVANSESEAKEIIDKQLEAFGLDRVVYDVVDKTCGVPVASPYYEDLPWT